MNGSCQKCKLNSEQGGPKPGTCSYVLTRLPLLTTQHRGWIWQLTKGRGLCCSLQMKALHLGVCQEPQVRSVQRLTARQGRLSETQCSSRGAWRPLKPAHHMNTLRVSCSTRFLTPHLSRGCSGTAPALGSPLFVTVVATKLSHWDQKSVHLFRVFVLFCFKMYLLGPGAIA